MAKTFTFTYFGSLIHAESLGTDFIPSINETLTSHCVPITDDGKIVAVNVIGRGIDIPGGHIDDNETAIEAAQRESQEEAQITVKDLVLIDVWRLSSSDKKLGLAHKPYLLLYSGNVGLINNFSPNDEVDERLILGPDDFIDKYFGDRRQAQTMIDAALASRTLP